MTLPQRLRRPAMFGLALGVVSCDVGSFVQDPKPIFEQTWNLPASNSIISVAELLPDDVSINSTPGSNPPDSSAFLVGMDDVVFSRRVGDDCGPCVTLNGQTAIKPAFILVSGSSSALPNDVVSGAVVGGLVTYSVTNNLSFDPIRVSTTPGNPQGHMIVVVRSGSLVLGRDSVNGATTPLPPGVVLTRPIAMTTGTATGFITVDLTITSPQGDHLEPINANGTVNTIAEITDMHAGSVRINVTDKPLTSIENTVDLSGLEEAITKRVVRGAFEMRIDNPFEMSGDLDVRFGYGPQSAQAVLKTIALPAATSPPSIQNRSVDLNGAEITNLLGNSVALTVSGAVSAPAPLVVTPKQIVSIRNRLILVLRTTEEN